MVTLSICMIVKNEEANLERCLSSLNIIMSKISTELIIVDTGSTDNTVKIAKNFTDKVYHHEWNNNFSDMRNISINYASGEWIFILDADEKIAISDGIIKQFQNSSNLKTYNTFLVCMRDFTKASDSNSYFEYVSPRFFKNNGSFYYEGSIHNQPMFKEPTQVIANALINHYGYDSDNESLLMRKVERTSKMLIEELKKNPEDIYYLYQLSAVYRMGKLYELGLIEIEKAYQIAIQCNDISEYRYVVKHYILMLKDLNHDYRVVELSGFLEPMIMSDLDLSFYFADSYQKLLRIELAKKYYMNYLELSKYYRGNREKFTDLSDVIQTSHLEKYVHAELSKINFKIKNCKEAMLHLLELPQDLISSEVIENAVKTLIQNNEYTKFTNLVAFIKSHKDKAINSFLIASVEAFFREEETFEKNEWMNRLITLEPSYDALLIAREAFEKGHKIDGKELIHFFRMFYKTEEIYYSDLLYFAMGTNTNIIEVLCDYPVEEVCRILNYLNGKYNKFKDYAFEILSTQSEANCLWVIIALEKVLMEIEDISIEMMEAIGIDLIINKTYWLSITYQNDAFKNRAIYLSAEDSFFAQIYNAAFSNLDKIDHELVNLKDNQVLEAKVLNLAIKNWNEVKRAITNACKQLNEVDKVEDVSTVSTDEFQVLTKMLFQQVNDQIISGEFEKAVRNAEEYLSIVPIDLSMISILSQALLLQKQIKITEKGAVLDQVLYNVEVLITKDWLVEASTVLKYLSAFSIDSIYYDLLCALTENNQEKYNSIAKHLLDNFDSWCIQVDLFPSILLFSSKQHNNELFTKTYCASYILNRETDLSNYDAYIQSEIDCLSHDPIKVFQGTLNIANQMVIITDELKKNGIKACSYSFEALNYIGQSADKQYDFSTYTQTSERIKAIVETVSNVIWEYNIFHFHFGVSMLSGFVDLQLIKKFGKKVVMHHWGSDVRQIDVAKKMASYAVAKVESSTIIENLKDLSAYVDVAIVDIELLPFVEPYYKHIELMPIAINLENIIPKSINEYSLKDDSIIIVHAPTSREIKGTDYIIQAVSRLQSKGYKIDFKLIEGMSNDRAIAMYREADLVIDQLRVGNFGFLAVENMAIGNPVITYICDYIKENRSDELPIISATPDDIESVLEYWIQHQKELAEVGLEGIEYVKKHHDIKILISNLINIYHKLSEGEYNI